MAPLNERNSLVIVLATHNRLSQLRRTINSVISQTERPHRLIVIDGGSTDGTIEYLKSDNRITPVFQGELLGTARAYNMVWREIDCKYTCWLSDDTEIVNGSLDLAVDILERNPHIGLVGLKMKDTAGPWKNLPYMGSISRYGIMNCNHGVLPLSLLRTIGYFNEGYRSYMIDPDLTASVLCTGRSVVLTKAVAILHHRTWAEAENSGAKEQRERGGLDNLGIYNAKFSFIDNGEQRKIFQSGGYSGYHVTVALNFVRRLVFRLSFHMMRLGLVRSREFINRFCGRFIDWDDRHLCVDESYHLRQVLPRRVLMDPANPYRHAFEASTNQGASGIED